MKAQNGRVPTAPAVEPWHGMSTWGPLSRRVADSALFYDAIKDGGPRFNDAVAQAPGRLRIAVSVRTPPLTGIQPDDEQRGAVHAVADALRSLGHEVVEHELEYRPALIAGLLSRYLRGVTDAGRAMPHPERLSRRTRGYLRIGSAIPPSAVRRARAAAAADEQALWPAGFDLVMTPMFTRRPAKVGAYEGLPAAVVLPLSIRFVPYCGQYNHTGQPAASVPAGFTQDGFPLAVQLVAPREGEPTLLALAAQLEEALAWPDRRPPL
jgi:amidase